MITAHLLLTSLSLACFVPVFRVISRSRSPSPPNDQNSPDAKTNGSDRQCLERERRERMARLRAENEAEERGGAAASLEPEASTIGRKRNRDEPSKQSDKNEDEESDEEQTEMMIMMGFGGFGSTKGKAVADNQSSAARGAASKNKGRKYRQYMNRKGGFNRPLDKMN